MLQLVQYKYENYSFTARPKFSQQQSSDDESKCSSAQGIKDGLLVAGCPRPSPAMAASTHKEARAKPAQPAENTKELHREPTLQALALTHGESEVWYANSVASHHKTYSRCGMYDFDDSRAGRVGTRSGVAQVEGFGKLDLVFVSHTVHHRARNAQRGSTSSLTQG